MSGPRGKGRLTDRRLGLHWDGGVDWSELEFAVTLDDGTREATSDWEGDPETGSSAEAGPLRASVTLAITEDGAALAVELTALRPGRVAEVSLAGSLPEAFEWLLANGYQSWDDSGYQRSAGSSWWTAAAADGRGSGLAAAAQSAEGSAVRFDLGPGRFAITWCEPKGLAELPILWEPEEGERRTLDRVELTSGEDVIASLAQIVPASSRPRKPVPQGWLSWYHFGPWVTGEDVLRHAGLLAGDPWARLGYDLVQIDDGWQLTYGDWEVNEKFESGLDGIAGRLAELGQTTGVWTAPLLVSESSALAAGAPDDWFVRRENGERATDPRHVVFGPMQILDGSNPDVQRHLRDTFARLHAEGIRYFKIDFLYAGAYARTSALRAAVAAIREGIGDDAYLLGCGAPLLPMLGLVDGCRIGPDTATPVYDFEHGSPKPIIFGEEVLAVARDVAFRHHLAAWFHLDADVALVGGNLSVEQGRQLVTLAALSGGPFFASDDLDVLEPDRRALLTNEDVLALVGGEPAVPDWEPNERSRPPTVWRRGPDVVALFNWSDQPATASAAVDAKATAVKDLWTGEQHAVGGGRVEANLPAHGTRLIRVIRG